MLLAEDVLLLLTDDQTGKFVGRYPDLVVSGINNGANMGDDTLYSGTVAAAMEGFLFGIPAIAFSQVDKGWAQLDAAARVARSIIEQVIAAPPAEPVASSNSPPASTSAAFQPWPSSKMAAKSPARAAHSTWAR